MSKVVGGQAHRCEDNLVRRRVVGPRDVRAPRLTLGLARDSCAHVDGDWPARRRGVAQPERKHVGGVGQKLLTLADLRAGGPQILVRGGAAGAPRCTRTRHRALTRAEGRATPIQPERSDPVLFDSDQITPDSGATVMVRDPLSCSHRAWLHMLMGSDVTW